MSPMVTDPSLINKTLRDLNAKIEELQQEATRTKSMMQLAKMGITMTLLNKLSSTQLTEVLCLVCVILHTMFLAHTGAVPCQLTC